MPPILINALSVSIGGGVTYARSAFPLLMEHLPDALLLCGPNLRDVFADSQRTVAANGYWARGSRRLIWEGLHLRGLLESHGIRTLFTPYQVATQPRTVASICVLRNLEPFFAQKYTYTMATSLRNGMLRFMTKRDLMRADVVIAVSDFVREFAVESLKIPEEKVVRIYHGRDESLVGSETESDVETRRRMGVGQRYVLTAGSMLPYRRVEDIVQAFDKVIAPLDPDAQLIVAGTGTDRGYMKKLEHVVATARHGNAVRLLGHVDRLQMRALYKGCDIFVSASEIEACPNIGIEAMTAGCSIIAAEAGPAREIYGDGVVFYTPRHATQLEDSMLMLWEGDGRNKDLRTRAIARSSLFSWSDCVQRTAKVLEST